MLIHQNIIQNIIHHLDGLFLFCTGIAEVMGSNPVRA